MLFQVELIKNPEGHPLPKPVEVLVSPGQKELVQIFLKVRRTYFVVSIPVAFVNGIYSATCSVLRPIPNMLLCDFGTFDSI